MVHTAFEEEESPVPPPPGREQEEEKGWWKVLASTHLLTPCESPNPHTVFIQFLKGRGLEGPDLSCTINKVRCTQPKNKSIYIVMVQLSHSATKGHGLKKKIKFFNICHQDMESYAKLNSFFTEEIKTECEWFWSAYFCCVLHIAILYLRLCILISSNQTHLSDES